MSRLLDVSSYPSSACISIPVFSNFLTIRYKVYRADSDRCHLTKSHAPDDAWDSERWSLGIATDPDSGTPFTLCCRI